MSKSSIAQLEAGEELDTLMAERIMRWKVLGVLYGNAVQDHDSSLRPGIGPYHGLVLAEQEDCWSPSTDDAAALQIVDHLVSPPTNWLFGLNAHVDGWRAMFGISHVGIAPTRPLAICRAALATLYDH